MSTTHEVATTSGAETAGGLLRKARQAQGLHIAALAALIKVAQRKLELLEADRLDELPDATFTRALAQTVCRSLKIDPAPVLALLPQHPAHRLEHLSEGLNTPFRERPGQAAVPKTLARLAGPAVWGPVLLLLAALLLFFVPGDLFKGRAPMPPSPAESQEPAAAAGQVSESDASADAIGAAMGSEGAASGVMERIEFVTPAFAASEPALSASEVSPSAPTPARVAMVQISATAESWVDVRDGNGKLVLSRKLVPGEPAAFDGLAPFRLKIGNAAATELVFRGERIDLGPVSRNNVARLELK